MISMFPGFPGSAEELVEKINQPFVAQCFCSISAKNTKISLCLLKLQLKYQSSFLSFET